jgi:tetratricopeptide (TPR) repeat protein
MKKVATLILALIAAIPVLAQGKYGVGQDSVDCVVNLSYYKEYLKQNDMANAISPWRKAIAICPPAASQNMFIDGCRLMRWAYTQAKDATRRTEILDSLIMLYDVRAAEYPKNAVTAMNNKAIDMINYKWKSNEPDQLFAELKKIVDLTGAKTSPMVLANYMQTGVDLYKNGLLPAEDLMTTYTDIAGYVDAALAEEADGAMVGAKQDIENKLGESGVASCDNLVNLFTPRYQANPDDKATLNTIVKLLGNSECLDSDLYLSAVEKLHGMEPTANTAYFLYKLYSSRDKNEEAAATLVDAIERCGDDMNKAADYCFELGSFYFKKMSKNAEAVSAAKKAMDLNPKLAGKCNLLIGTIWASVSCGGNELERRAKYWVAVDYMNKAKAADPSLAEDADRQAAQYRAYFPQQADAFMYDVQDGQAYTAGCGALRETTTVRTVK